MRVLERWPGDRISGVTDPGRPVLSLDRLEAVVFDTDGVLTDTARVHAAAWKRLFDEYLMRRGSQRHEPFRAFTEADYLRHVDGRSRYDGVAGFLSSRGITLPWGDPADPPDRETVCGLGTPRTASSSPTSATTAPRPSPPRSRSSADCGSAGADGRGIGQPQHGPRTEGSRGTGPVRRRGRRGRGRPARAGRQARPGAVSGGRPAARGGAGAGRGRRGCPGRGGGRPPRPVRSGRRVDRGGHVAALVERGADVVVADLGELALQGGPVRWGGR